MDNVISSSTSTIVRQLRWLGLALDEPHYTAIAEQQLANVVPHISSYGSAYANWATQLLDEVSGSLEVVLTGPGWQNLRRELDQHYVPNKMISGGTKGSLPLLAGRIGKDRKSTVCSKQTIIQPEEAAAELMQLNKS